ncbi:hypothetical protein ABZ070_24695 [Streptomyces sp. NPDC006283]|uniref:hypothetical protein n=1 Tax=Streptomyces sp. NPDC006283 TaxID=3156741 RepID=UPI0033A10EF7
MTTTLLPRSVAVANPEYACGTCGGWHAGTCPAAANRRLGQLLARMAVEADARVPDESRARRMLQEMAPGYERQPVLVLHRPEMNDACAICGLWLCRGKCWQAAPAPAGANAKAAIR